MYFPDTVFAILRDRMQSRIVFYFDENDIDFLHEFSGQSRNVDLAGRVVLNEQKQPVFNFGKHRNKKVVDVFKVEPSYYKWMMEGDFSLDTKRKLTNIYLQSKQQ